MFNDVSLIIKTFERPEALTRLLDSVRTLDFDGAVLVADDSKKPYRESILDTYGDLVDEYITLPFNVGLSAGRNALLDRVQTPYFVLNDDDFVYGPRTDLRWMRSQLAATDLELLGGLIWEPNPVRWSRLRQPTLKETLREAYSTARTLLRNLGEAAYSTNRFHGHIEATEDTVTLSHDRTPNAVPFHRCDYTLNFFMAETDAVRAKVGGWAEELKVQEHWEFFYRAKLGGLHVAYTDKSGVIHIPDRTAHYNSFREHQTKYRRLGLELHGLRKLVLGDWTAATIPGPDPAAVAE